LKATAHLERLASKEGDLNGRRYFALKTKERGRKDFKKLHGKRERKRHPSLNNKRQKDPYSDNAASSSSGANGRKRRTAILIEEGKGSGTSPSHRGGEVGFREKKGEKIMRYSVITGERGGGGEVFAVISQKEERGFFPCAPKRVEEIQPE